MLYCTLPTHQGHLFLCSVVLCVGGRAHAGRAAPVRSTLMGICGGLGGKSVWHGLPLRSGYPGKYRSTYLASFKAHGIKKAEERSESRNEGKGVGSLRQQAHRHKPGIGKNFRGAGGSPCGSPPRGATPLKQPAAPRRPRRRPRHSRGAARVSPRGGRPGIERPPPLPAPLPLSRTARPARPSRSRAPPPPLPGYPSLLPSLFSSDTWSVTLATR